MPETPEEYRERLANYIEGKDALILQREAPRTLARLIEGIPEERLRRHPAPKKWSVVESSLIWPRRTFLVVGAIGR